MKEWVKYGIIFFLGMTCVYQYLSLRQAATVVQMMQADVNTHIMAINNQCKDLLVRQGWIVSQPVQPKPEQPKEEGKEDVEKEKVK